ncbi:MULTISPECIES: DUF47 domain-containing protein [unclassified Paenibacillus]|uniref:DUF47 domain-containing protein n=1 Tax=unclassified Paenibacillus TaxID=185978 RepID=UPI001C115BD5|nr:MULTISPECIES: DUF47 family protein [unclassified Paenibacillus]MBU5443534.1 DUF47 family protein [Paenibacillus sp. MSJ-34]CAH0120558.1 hypothetical protein PAE9249_03077 [Paenibacillus sp. CECT 9249]
MFKRNDIFFETLQNMSDTIVQAIDHFAKGVANPGDLPTFAKVMKEYESKCDGYVHKIVTELNKTFITPIERDDIMELATSLDDVMDGVEACVSRFDMYQMKDHDKQVVVFAGILQRCAVEIQDSIRLLSQKKLLAIREHTIRVNELENEGDEILRTCIKSLFATVTDPIELIKRKEIYERLEQTTDYCEDVANTLESIIMRNS